MILRNSWIETGKNIGSYETIVEDQDFSGAIFWMLTAFCSASEWEVEYQDLHLPQNMAERNNQVSESLEIETASSK